MKRRFNCAKSFPDSRRFVQRKRIHIWEWQMAAYEILIQKMMENRYNDFVNTRPLLSHYTSMITAEIILREKTIWFSNPMFMNDFEEYQFGMEMAKEVIEQSQSVLSLEKNKEGFGDIIFMYSGLYQRYKRDHSLDIFLMCLSQHDLDDNDGYLSMWRAYGGNGSGVALVFDTKSISVEPDSPITIAKVDYKTSAQRKSLIESVIGLWCSEIDSKIDASDAWDCVCALFDAMKLLSLTIKNIGFREEQEWRVIYLPERDRLKALDSYKSYIVGPHGIEPKLKLRIAPIKNVLGAGTEFSKLLQRIILGPARSSELTADCFNLMLEKIGHQDWKNIVVSSSIPFRSRV